jgi:hypothetical protein
VAVRDERHAEPHGDQPAEDAEGHVGEGDRDVSLFQSRNRLDSEGRKRRESAQEAGEEKHPRVGRKPLLAFDEPRQNAGDEAADDVHDQRAEREVRGRVMKHQAAELGAADGAQAAAEADEKKVFHGWNSYVKCVAGHSE